MDETYEPQQTGRSICFLALMILPFGPSRFAVVAEPTRSEFTLNIDVYSGSVSSSELESGFRLGLLELKKGIQLQQVLCDSALVSSPLQHRVEKDFLIGESGEEDGEKVVAVAHVTTQPNGKLRSEFSELGWPLAFDGATQLIVGKGEPWVLQLPATETDKGGGTLRTVVAISTPAPQQGDREGHRLRDAKRLFSGRETKFRM